MSQRPAPALGTLLYECRLRARPHRSAGPAGHGCQREQDSWWLLFLHTQERAVTELWLFFEVACSGETGGEVSNAMETAILLGSGMWPGLGLSRGRCRQNGIVDRTGCKPHGPGLRLRPYIYWCGELGLHPEGRMPQFPPL